MCTGTNNSVVGKVQVGVGMVAGRYAIHAYPDCSLKSISVANESGLWRHYAPQT